MCPGLSLCPLLFCINTHCLGVLRVLNIIYVIKKIKKSYTLYLQFRSLSVTLQTAYLTSPLGSLISNSNIIYKNWTGNISPKACTTRIYSQLMTNQYSQLLKSKNTKNKYLDPSLVPFFFSGPITNLSDKFYCHWCQNVLSLAPMITSTVPTLVDISVISHCDCCNCLLTAALDSILPCCSFFNAQIKITSYKCKLIPLKTFSWLPFFSQSKGPRDLCLIWPLVTSLISFPTTLLTLFQPHWASCSTLNIPDSTFFIERFTLTCPSCTLNVCISQSFYSNVSFSNKPTLSILYVYILQL